MTASVVEISIFEPDREKTTRMKKLIIAVLTILALFIDLIDGNLLISPRKCL